MAANVALALAVFVGAVVVDVLWGFYIRRVGDGRAIPAANYTACIVLIGAANVIGYTDHHWLVLPMAVGGWVGTYAVVRWDHWRARTRG